MDSHTGKLAFTIGIFIFIFALIPLPFLKLGSAEFIVDIMALFVSITFLSFVIWNVRKHAMVNKRNLSDFKGKSSKKDGEPKR